MNKKNLIYLSILLILNITETYCQNILNYHVYHGEINRVDSIKTEKNSRILYLDTTISNVNPVMYIEFSDTLFKSKYYEFSYFSDSNSLFNKREYNERQQLVSHVIADENGFQEIQYYGTGQIRSLRISENIKDYSDSLFSKIIIFHENGSLESILESKYIYNLIVYNDLGGISKRGEMHFDKTWVNYVASYNLGILFRIDHYQSILKFRENNNQNLLDGESFVLNEKGKCISIENYEDGLLISKSKPSCTQKKQVSILVDKFKIHN